MEGTYGYYSSPDEVIAYTGVTPDDLRLKTNEELQEVLIGWLQQAKSFIDANRNRDYGAENNIPPGIHNIALRIVGNMIAVAAARRDTKVVTINNIQVGILEDKIFTTAIKTELSQFPPKPRMGLFNLIRK